MTHVANEISPRELEDRSLVPNWMTTNSGANFSAIPKSFRITLETVLPPMPCHLMERSPSICKFLANISLKFWRRKTCRRRMKEWPRIKIRSDAIKKRCLKKKLNIMRTCLKKLKRSARGKSFLGICLIWWREEERKISRWNCLSYARHVTYLNLIGQTNASIESVPGTSQPQRNITCAPLLDINYITSRHNVRLYVISTMFDAAIIIIIIIILITVIVFSSSLFILFCLMG